MRVEDELYRLRTKSGFELSLDEALKYGEFWVLESECPFLELDDDEKSPLVDFLKEEMA